MKVFIAGASGVLGRRLVRQLTARGHSVIGQARSAKAESVVKAAGGEPRHADLFDAESLSKAAEGCDTVIHAATAIPTKQKPAAADWAMNDHIRRKGTRCLTEAAAKIGAKTYLQQSITWVARPKDDSPFDEDSPVVPDPAIQSAIDAETIAREAGSLDGFTVAILRGGYFYDSESAHTRMIADGLRKRQMPIIGTGDAAWAMIHTDEFAARLGARPPRRIPVWLAKWLAGEQALAYFTRSTRTTNARLRRDFAWTPRYPTYREGLDQIVAAWKAESSSGAAASAARA